MQTWIYFYLFLHTTDSQKYLKNQKNFILTQRFRHLHHLSLQIDLQIQRSRLDDLPKAGHKTFFNKIVRDYDKIMKSSDLKHLCDNVYSKEVSLLCNQKFVALVLFRCWKKAIFKKIKSDVSIVSSNNESEV